MPQLVPNSLPVEHTPDPVYNESSYNVPKPSANEDEYESSVTSTDYSPTPSEFQDDIDYVSGKYDDYDSDIDITELIEYSYDNFRESLEIFSDVVQWFL